MESKNILNIFKEVVNKGSEKENELLNSIKNDVKLVKIKFIYGEKNEVHDAIMSNAETINRLIELIINENENFKSKVSERLKGINTFLDM